MKNNSDVNISAVVLTKDEQDNISRCLKSIIWCGEIMLIDNSTDNTLKLAKKIIPENKLRVFQPDKTKNFAELRNFALNKAKFDWILFIDADEQVTPELRQEISNSIAKLKTKGFYIPRRDYFLGKFLRFGETGQTKLLKLGKKGAGKWQRRVHEKWQISGKTDTLKIPILHYPHPTIEEFINRINRWTDLDAVEFFDAGIKSSWWKIIAYPLGKFMLNYGWRLGFLDGFAGLVLALGMSFHSFLTRAKLYLLQDSITNRSNYSAE